LTGSFPITPLDEWIGRKIGAGPGRLNRELLERHQVTKVNETLELAVDRSTHYRRILGCPAPRMRSLVDVESLPFTQPDQLRDGGFPFLCVRQDEVDRIVTLPTSGTTGAPKRLFFTAEDQELTRDFFHWGMSTLVQPGDRVLILLPGELPGSVGNLLQDGLLRMNVEGIQHGPVVDHGRTLEMMHEQAVTSLVGIPVQVVTLAKLWEANPTLCGDLSIRTVLLSTDHVPDSIVRTLERIWGCVVFNHYGMTEMGLGGGVDCSARRGYHLREADMFFEIVDPATGKPVPDGSEGEIVFTTLTRRAMPLIRYRTGDLGRFLPGSCECGTCLRTLSHVSERAGTRLPLPRGKYVRLADFDEALLGLPGVADFQVAAEVGAAGRVTLDIDVFPVPDVTPPSAEHLQRVIQDIPAVRAVGGDALATVTICDHSPGGRPNPGTNKRKIIYQLESVT
jgi:phenylacetate-coenzyme A ligase PaaK-like adenylate-forming protein